MHFLIQFYRRSTGKIISIVRECFNRVAFKLYHMRAPSLMFETVLYLGHLFKFLANHRRLPIRPNTLFNDFLFQLGSSSELGSPLRTFITDKEFGKIYVEKKLGGWCWWYRKYAPGDTELERLGKEARDAKKGLWADPQPVPPWELVGAEVTDSCNGSRQPEGMSSLTFPHKLFLIS